MEIDKIIHQPIRTQLVAHLAAYGPTDYVTLRNVLKLTDGDMATHMRQLVASEYVIFEKEFVKNKPRTTYKLTPLGRKQFAAYVKALAEIIKMG